MENANKTDEGTISATIDRLIDNDVWNGRLQGRGCTIDKLKNKYYRASKIPSIGPKGDELYYPELFSIAVDMSKEMYSQKEMGIGWMKVPKNTNIGL